VNSSKRFAQNLNAVYVLWLRDVKRFVRTKSRFLGSLGMPFFFLIFFSLGFRRATIPTLKIPYVDFVTPGIVTMILLFSGTFSGVSVVWDRQFGFLREILVSPASRISIAFGRILGGTTVAMIQAVMMIFVSLFVGFNPNLLGIPMALIFMFLTGITFTGIGVVFSTQMRDMHGFQLVVNFFVFPLFLLSGALFPIDELGRLKWLALLNPMSYGVDGVRWCLTGYTEINPTIDFAVLLLVGAVSTILAGFLFSRMEE
jgi:ABC-2 type transport system permease protein